MVQITDYSDLAALAETCLRPGVYTNVMVTRDKFAGEIAAGTLSAKLDGHNLLIAVRRSDHVRLYFYINDLTRPLYSGFDVPAVTEIAFRIAGDRTVPVREYFEGCGFSRLLRRIRLSRPAGLPASAVPSGIVYPTDTAEISAFLTASFSPLTGCLPAEAEILSAMGEKRFLALRDDRGLAGLIHLCPERNAAEIRHLAVREDLRGRGLARRLVSAGLSAMPHKLFRVWVREDLTPAHSVYASAGFSPDGWASQVFLLNRK